MSIGENTASGDKFFIIEAMDECDSESRGSLKDFKINGRL
jgi:hypothetical protein